MINQNTNQKQINNDQHYIIGKLDTYNYNYLKKFKNWKYIEG